MLVLLLLLAFSGLGYRLVNLQVLRHDELSVVAQRNTERTFLFVPRRGDILDAKGNLLATSSFLKVVCADPSLIGTNQVRVAHLLAPLLQTSEMELAQRLSPRAYINEKGEIVPNQYVRLKTKVPVETWEKIRAAMSNLTFAADEKKLPRTAQSSFRALREQGIFAQDYPIRLYPNQSLAAHVLGFAATEEREMDKHRFNEIEGRDGIERSLNSKLEGVPGWRLTEIDRKGHELVSLREQDVEPRDGLNVVLTIDSVLQHILESALAETMETFSPAAITGIIVRPRTGEILAMANLPTFDPNNPGGFPPDSLRNRAIADIMEPGSTFKTIVVSAALNEHAVSLNDQFFCENGAFIFGGHTLHDAEGHHFGNLAVREIIMKSSNIGAAKIGIRLGKDTLYRYIQDFGFGARTGIPLPGEVNVKVRAPTDWYKVSIAQIPMGQGINVTRLQMAMAVSAIANRGCLMHPMIVDRLEDQDGNVVAKYAPEPVRQVISEEAAAQMIEALKMVVSPDGTAPKAHLDHYTVAGKTGTAEKAGVGGYLPGKFFSSFIGFFPADNPEICIAVVLDEPDMRAGHFGGIVAAPAFKNVAERAASYLNIRPDVSDTTTQTIAGVQSERSRTVSERQRD